jgi:hypothetical protein
MALYMCDLDACINLFHDELLTGLWRREGSFAESLEYTGYTADERKLNFISL